MAWFKKTRKPMASSTAENPSRVPEGLWVKCPGCTQIIYNKDLEKNLSVCPKCAHHFRLSAAERLRTLLDEPEWTEHFSDLASNDPLQFTDTKPYRDRLRKAVEATGLNDAIIIATGHLDGLPVVIAAMEYAFIGGSMGVVMGEKITRAIEMAIDERRGRHHRVVLRRRPHDGGRAVADADGEGLGGARPPRAGAPAVHFGAHRSHDRRRHGQLRHARRSEHRRAEGAHRLRRAARHRADHPAEAARRLPAQRVPGRARHARSRRRSPRDEGGDRPCAAVHATAKPSAPAAAVAVQIEPVTAQQV